VINPESLVIKQGYAEPSLAQAEAKLTSLSVKVTSASTAAMQPQPVWCSTAPSVCVIPGRKSANKFPSVKAPHLAALFLFQNQPIKLFIFAMRINPVTAR
jgi:hypothetical protein